MTDHTCPDLDQLQLQAGQRPVGHGLGQLDAAQEGGQIVRQGVQLQPHLIVAELPARQPRPAKGVFALFDVLLGGAALSTVAKLWENRLSKILMTVSSAGLMLVILFSAVFADIYFDISDTEAGVVIAHEGRVYAAPSKSSNLLFVIHEGTKAEISSRQYPWIEIELIDGKKGWLDSKVLRPL